MAIGVFKMNKKTILKKIDGMSSFTEKLEYLNKLFLQAKNNADEEMILDMIKQLKFWGR